MNFGRSREERQRSEQLRQQRRLEERLKKDQEAADKRFEQFRRHSELLARHQATIADLERIRDHELRYANTIVLLGYGGFFALWGTQVGKMPIGLFGIAGVLISLSLLCFVGFEIAKITAVSRAVTKGQKLEMSEEQTIGLSNMYLDKVHAWWLPPFIVAVTTGFAAGIIVLWAFVQSAVNGSWV